MNRKLKNILYFAAWGVVACYMVVAYTYSKTRQKSDTCKNISVSISNPSSKFVTPEIVRGWYEGKKLIGTKLDDINTFELEAIARQRAYVKNVKAYVSKPGRLVVEITQRVPTIRLCSSQGHNIYLDDDWCVLPFQRQFVAEVPLVTGDIPLPFRPGDYGANTSLAESVKKKDKSWLFLTKLINFVRFIEDDSFWNSFIVQINVVEGGDIELVPRAGNHVILLGNLDNYERNLEKLLTFYESGKGEWEQYRYINIKFRNQVICSK